MKNVIFDFDGVINSYKSGWEDALTISDPPVEGIKEAIAEVRKAGYAVYVVSSRCTIKGGTAAIREYLDKYGIEVDGVRATKPPAVATIDDRAICFDGHPETLLAKIEEFKPWNRK